MRDIKRINKILGLIKKIWKENPDLRLCQLIKNCFNSDDIYYVEDEELERSLKFLYLEEEGK